MKLQDGTKSTQIAVDHDNLMTACGLPTYEANLDRIAELEKALNDLLFYPQGNAEYTAKVENARNVLKG